MMPEDELSFRKLAHDSVPWVTIGSSAVAICSFLILLGMWLGPQKDVPAQLAKITSQLNEIYARMDKTDWAIEALKNQTNAIGMQVSVASEDRNKLWDLYRELKAVVTQLQTTGVSREVLLEWKADLEQRNKNLTTPPLPKAR